MEWAWIVTGPGSSGSWPHCARAFVLIGYSLLRIARCGAQESWSDITPENLREWLSLHGQGEALRERLTSEYWVNLVR